MEYLKEDPAGNLTGLRKWASKKYDAEEVNEEPSKQLVWVDHMEEAQKVSQKTLSNLLSRYRKS